MKTKMILACAGMAACATQAQVDRPALQSADVAGVIYPDKVQAIKGITMDGELVLGEERLWRPSNVAARGGITVVDLYNGAGLMDTDGDGSGDPVCGDVCAGLTTVGSRWFFGPTFDVSAIAEDFAMPAAAVDGAPKFSGFNSLINWVSCDGDGDPLTTGDEGSEPMILIFTMYNSIETDLTANLDGTDGFDNDGDGVPETPYSRTDVDGDGLVDEFSGGVVVTFANIDTDGDTTNGNEVLDADTAGYYVLYAEELTDDGMGGGLGSEDFGDIPNTDLDGDPADYEGTMELFVAGSEGPDTDGDGAGDSGDIFGRWFATTNVAQVMLWGGPADDSSACTPGAPEESSLGLGWAQGNNSCPAGSLNEGAGFSDGSVDGGVVNNIWDPSVDATDFTAAVGCPDPLAYAITVQGEGTPPNARLCADANEDGVVSPADFNAWIIAFNTPIVNLCDNNNDGLCTPADFNAWIINFNLGAGGPTCP